MTTATLCERVVHGRMDENVLLLELFQHTQVKSDVRRGESQEIRERRSKGLFIPSRRVLYRTDEDGFEIHCGVKYFKMFFKTG